MGSTTRHMRTWRSEVRLYLEPVFPTQQDRVATLAMPN